MRECKLIIKDEVNVKIEGLDLDTRKRLTNRFKYEVPYARYLPAVRLGRWDGKVGFFQLGGSTYINLLPEILQDLDDHDWDIELEDLRDYKINYDFTEVDTDSYADIMWPNGHPAAGQPIELRDYQVEIINNFLKNTLKYIHQ